MKEPTLSPLSKSTLRPQFLKLALRADSGLSVGQVIPITQARTILGRSVEAGIAVDDSKVSRSHAAIDIQNGFHRLVDLGSTNGTYLNGRRVENCQILNPGDEIRVGSTVYVVELLDKVKHTAGKTWREATSIMMSAQPRQAVVSSHPRSATPAPFRAGKPAAAHGMLDVPRARLSPTQLTYARWAVAAVSLLVTAAAIAIRIG